MFTTVPSDVVDVGGGVEAQAVQRVPQHLHVGRARHHEGTAASAGGGPEVVAGVTPEGVEGGQQRRGHLCSLQRT